LETLGKRVPKMNVQIFGTDLSESTIEHARAGIYSSAIEKDVSPLRLRRFFAKRDGTYQIIAAAIERVMKLRRATPAVRSAFNILPTDIGRRITELRPNIDVPDLENILRDMTETLNICERKVRDPEGREYSLRVRPYRTTDNKIDGVVITLVDLQGKKEIYAGKTSNRAKEGSQQK
jgi:PAS domain/CheR methyltransferase, SAM binding domain